MKPFVLALATIFVLHATPAACQKARILLRGPTAEGRATQQAADSLAEHLRLSLLRTGVVELVAEPKALPSDNNLSISVKLDREEEPAADEVIEGKLRKSGDTFALTLTSSITATRTVDTFHGEAKSLEELCTQLLPTFVHQVTERHGQDHLLIRIERGFNIYPMDKYFGVSDPFVEVYVDTTLVGVTQVRQDEKDPVWNEEFALPSAFDREVTLLVFDKDALEHRELIGTVSVPWGKDGIYPIRRPRYVRSFGKIKVSFGR